jgi:hypothetical protein
MTLPPKALQALVSIRAELLSKDPVESVIITPKPVVKEPKRFMRHAKRGGAFQTMCRNRDWASPIY